MRRFTSFFVNPRWNGWTVFPTSRHDLRQKDQMKCQGENLCLTDFACFLYTLVTVLREMHSRLSIRIYKNDVKRCTINPLQRWIARQPMVVLLTLEGNCSCRRAIPAHFGCHLPLPKLHEPKWAMPVASREWLSLPDLFKIHASRSIHPLRCIALRKLLEGALSGMRAP